MWQVVGQPNPGSEHTEQRAWRRVDRALVDGAPDLENVKNGIEEFTDVAYG